MNTTEYFLEHHGIKGQKWGIRHKPGPDGLVPSKKSSKNSSHTTRYQKSPKQLSDAELTKRIKRLELEKKYSDLNTPAKYDGKKYVTSLLESTGKTLTGAAVGGTATFFIQRALRNKFVQ